MEGCLPASVLEALTLSPVEACRFESPASQNHQETAVTGTIVRTFFYSTRVFFFDVALDAGRNQDDEVLGCIYRQGALHPLGSGEGGLLKAVDVLRLSKSVEIGDLVELRYVNRQLDMHKGQRSFDVTHLSVLEKGCNKAAPRVRPPAFATQNIITKTKAVRAPKGEFCKFWLNSKMCPLVQCTLKHVSDEERKQVKAAWLDERRSRRAATYEAQGKQGEHVQGKRSKKNRASIFVQWLIANVGKDVLGSGSGVLDVAGGKGEITCLLRQAGIQSTVIDPRDCHGKNGQHSVQDDAHLLQTFDKALWENEQHGALLEECSMVIAMHPDQATEPAIDFALAKHKRFAVVPCCVFGRTSDVRLITTSENNTDDSELVITYEQYIKYRFQGRDTVLHLLDIDAVQASGPQNK